VLYISDAIVYCVIMATNRTSAIQLRFKEAGRFITILKDGKLTRGDIVALIKEALAKSRIVDLNGRDLRALNLSGLNLGRADLSNANLSRSDLSNTILFNANLHSTDFSNANLSYIDFSYADLSGAKLNGANMYYAVLLKAIMPVSV